MFQWILVGLSLFAVGPAFAQSEVEKRRQHVPYVRAATDCVAAVIRRDDQFDNAVAYDSFQPLINRAVAVCQQSISLMITTHDAIFGFGGQAFYAGPYLADLERAVRGRLAGQIASSRISSEKQAAERQAAEERARAERIAQQERERTEREAASARAEAQRLEAENRAQVARAEKLDLLQRSRDLIRAKTLACIGKEGATMLLTDEKAEVIAKAAMIFCESDVDALIRVTTEIVEAESNSPVNRQQVRGLAESRVREVVTAYIIRSRGDLIGKNLKEQQTPSSAPGVSRSMPTL